MNTDNFQWSDEEAIDFANFCQNNRLKYNPTEFKKVVADFKASKQQSIRDWEVVSRFEFNDDSKSKNCLGDIKSVKRLSDGEVFSIGDEIYSERNIHKIKITSIKVINDSQVYLEHCPLEFAHHFNQPLFTFEDLKNCTIKVKFNNYDIKFLDEEKLKELSKQKLNL